MALSFRFDLPPEEALKFFRAKGYRVSFAWQDVWQQEHEAAFTVAKLLDLDLLKDVRAAVDKAISEGQTFEQFRDNLEPTLVDAGWWGRKKMVDPQTGEEREVQLGSVRRLRTIFRVNMQAAYAAGNWAQVEDNANDAPWLMYDAVDDDRTRPEHKAWDGTVLRYDDPFWAEHTPPNGWNCRCSIIQLSDRDLERIGKKPDTKPPRHANESSKYVNPRTGEETDVPRGIDPGWAYNPGKERYAQLRATEREKLEDTPTAMATTYIAALAGDGFARWLKQPQGNYPVTYLSDTAAQTIGAKNRVTVFSAESALKNWESHPELTASDYRGLLDVGLRPSLIVQDGESTIVIVDRGGGKLYWSAVKTTETGLGTFVTSFRRTNRDDVRALVRRGKVISGEWKE